MRVTPRHVPNVAVAHAVDARQEGEEQERRRDDRQRRSKHDYEGRANDICGVCRRLGEVVECGGVDVVVQFKPRDNVVLDDLRRRLGGGLAREGGWNGGRKYTLEKAGDDG